MITYKEEFVGCEKYCRAYELGGGDAIMMWGALKCYAAKHPDNAGFVPDEDIERLIGAPREPRKALDALIQCGRLLRDGTRGAGLVEAAAGGWQLHDYLDHAANPEDEELRREKQRIKKQLQREQKRAELDLLKEQTLCAARRLSPVSPGTRGDMSRDTRGTCPGDGPQAVPGTVPGTVLAGARPHAHARTCAPAHAPARPQPNPTQPNPLSLPEEREAYLSNPVPEAEPELPAPQAAHSERRWRSFPKGWRGWSIDTASEAVAQGLTTTDLAGHVDYWTLRAFPGGAVSDLDGELRRGIPGIVARKRKATAATATAPPAAQQTAADPYGWAPTADHRALATRYRRDLRHPIEAYRAARMPERIGTTLRINEDFKRRLQWWCEHGGEFPATGKLSRFEASRLPAKAVGA